MKTIKNCLRLLFMLVIFSGAVFSQSKTEAAPEKPESPYDEINLSFALGAEPTPEAVGFDEPKSRWKFSYELRFLENEKAALEKSGFRYWRENPNENAAERARGIETNRREFDKAWKKFGVRAAKGKVSKTSLLSEESREIVIPAQLSPEIKNVLARANATNMFPDFRIYIKGKIYSKTKSNLKFKQNFSQSYTCPTKMIIKGAPVWMANVCGIFIGIINQNNKISIGSTSRF